MWGTRYSFLVWMTLDEALSEDARVAPHLPLVESLEGAERIYGMGPQANWRRTGMVLSVSLVFLGIAYAAPADIPFPSEYEGNCKCLVSVTARARL